MIGEDLGMLSTPIFEQLCRELAGSAEPEVRCAGAVLPGHEASEPRTGMRPGAAGTGPGETADPVPGRASAPGSERGAEPEPEVPSGTGAEPDTGPQLAVEPGLSESGPVPRVERSPEEDAAAGAEPPTVDEVAAGVEAGSEVEVGLEVEPHSGIDEDLEATRELVAVQVSEPVHDVDTAVEPDVTQEIEVIPGFDVRQASGAESASAATWSACEERVA